MKAQDLVREIEERLSTVAVRPGVTNVGHVISVGDGIIRVDGLSRAGFGEQVELEDGRRGLILHLEEDYASVLMLSEDTGVPEGMEVRTTGKLLSLRIGEELLGRVVDPFGNPLDDRPLEVTSGEDRPLERIAPGVTERKPVDQALKTGIKAVDALTPIGRG
ncbi:MAG TPA: F0F1 ATP synthase subunit alpha, partial [Spirochaetia bacterium]|nr:F0F1 ATP synthase subunit alpha [Spirochaetia bacterium]